MVTIEESSSPEIRSSPLELMRLDVKLPHDFEADDALRTGYTGLLTKSDQSGSTRKQLSKFLSPLHDALKKSRQRPDNI